MQGWVNVDLAPDAIGKPLRAYSRKPRGEDLDLLFERHAFSERIIYDLEMELRTPLIIRSAYSALFFL